MEGIEPGIAAAAEGARDALLLVAERGCIGVGSTIAVGAAVDGPSYAADADCVGDDVLDTGGEARRTTAGLSRDAFLRSE